MIYVEFLLIFAAISRFSHAPRKLVYTRLFV